jgi:hypothetical protein
MQSNQYSQYYYPTSAPTVSAVDGYVAFGVARALLTATSSVAREIRNVKEHGKDPTQAVVSVAKETIGTSLANVAGAVVGKTLFRSSALGFATMLAVSVGVKYAYDGLTTPKVAEAATTPVKAAKSK